MDILQNLTVTDISSVCTVRNIKGMTTEVERRPYYGISFCYEGQITYTYNGVSYVSGRDCAIILPKGATYSLCCNKDGYFPLINFDCAEFLCDRHIVLPLENPSAVLKEYEYIKKMSLFEANRLNMMSAFYALIGSINSQTNEDDLMVGRAMAYLEHNLSDPSLTNEILAKQANVSEVYFRRIFLKQYGITPRQYIINSRIAKAKQMLYLENKKISAIAEECGFTSVYHFCRCFKERTGMTPTEYMKSNKTFGL